MFEHSKILFEENLDRRTMSGIWYNPNGTNPEPNGYNDGWHRFTESVYELPADTSLNEYHTFGCLWLPNKVNWFVDGILVNEETNYHHIPQYPMFLKITHKQDKLSKIDGIWQVVTDTMTVNNAKGYRLKTNCDDNSTIRSLSDFKTFYYSVKRSIAIGATTGILAIPNNANFTLRAVESIIIDGGFELPIGASMTLITQKCPECSPTQPELIDDSLP